MARTVLVPIDYSLGLVAVVAQLTNALAWPSASNGGISVAAVGLVLMVGAVDFIALLFSRLFGPLEA